MVVKGEFNIYSQRPAVKKDSKNGAARKKFGLSYLVTALVASNYKWKMGQVFMAF